MTDPRESWAPLLAELTARREHALAGGGPDRIQREHDHGRFRPGLGDWSEKIRSGEIQPPDPLPSPEEIPPELREISERYA